MSSSVEQIKERLDIVDVISSYLKVEKAGINFKAKCPFHNEKTPSFFISPSRQSFYCFGCGEKGDIFSFVQKFEGLDFRGALESLAQKAGVELQNFKRESTDEKDKLFEIMERAAKFYENRITGNTKALDYLGKRGLSQTSQLKWRLGFAPDEWRSLHDHLISSGSTKAEMLSAGLIKKVPDEEKYYDTFRNRIMFPIFDSAGRVIAFSGRAMSESEKTPKYLNSPETKLFYKSEVLYGMNVAKNHIRKSDYAVLVEGQMDLLMSHQAGVFNTVASSGTALTELHLAKIKKLSNRVVVAYDSDEAGIKAGTKAATLALSLGMEVKISSLAEGEDPADAVKENPEKWKTSLKNSEHLIDFALRKTLESGGKNPTKEVFKNVLPLLNLLSSEMEKSQFIKKIAMKLKIPEEAVRSDLQKISASKKENPEIVPLQKTSSVINLERIISGIVFLEELKEETETRSRWRKISEKDVDEILEPYSAKKEALIFEVEKLCGGGEMKKIAEEVLSRIELQNLKAKLARATISLDGGVSKKEEKEISEEIGKIQNRIKELNKII